MPARAVRDYLEAVGREQTERGDKRVELVNDRLTAIANQDMFFEIVGCFRR